MTPALALGFVLLLASGTGAPAKPPASKTKQPAAARPVPPAPPASFTGHWKLDVAASAHGGARVPRLRTEDIVEDGAWTSVHEVIVRDDDDTTSLDYRYRTDGESVNKVAGQEVRTKGSREGAALKFESVAKILMLDVKQVERWSLADSAATLTMERDSRTPLGQQQQRLVFRRTH